MRRECSERPLVVAFLALCCGLATSFSAWNILYALALVPLLDRAKAWAGLVLGLALGLLLRPEAVPGVVVGGGVYEGTAVVDSVPSVSRRGYVATVSAHGTRYVLWLAPDERHTLGDTLRLRAEVLPFQRPQYARAGTVAVLRPTGPVERVSDGPWLWKLGASLRDSFLAMVARHGRPETAALVDALCFNVTSGIEPALYEDLRRSGTLHIVSTSGLHVVIVAAAVGFALAQLPLARALRLLVLFGALVLYAAASGFRPPIVRAVAMVVLGLAAYLFRREPDGLSAIAASGTGYLAWSPESVADIGFQLSYVATAALVLTAYREEPGPTAWSRILVQPALRVAHASLVATLALAPLLAYHFGQVPLVGPLANVLIAAPVAIAVVASLAAWSVSTIWLALAVGLMRLFVEPFAGWVMVVARWASGLPFASIEVPRPEVPWMVALYACAMLLWRPRLRPPGHDSD
jgi:competence protein ComEC